MTYETMPIEAKDASRVHILTGIVTDTGDGVVDVNIDDHGVVSDIPVFYHCPESETADGMPFSIDDRVIIVNSGSAVSPSIANMKVIGFEDGLPRECGFKLKLTRGDGTLITEDSGLFGGIDLWDSDWKWYEITTPVYNASTEYWSFNLVNPGDANPEGYLLWYSCSDGISTQYPYRYKSSDQGNISDQVQPGIYEDIIPYWKTTFSYVDIIPGSTITCPDIPYDPAHRGGDSFVMSSSLSWRKRYNVKSSVPYKVIRQAKSIYKPAGGSNNINDHFFFNFTGQPSCCTTGSGCWGTSPLSCGDIASAKISGGALDQNVTRKNIFDVLDYTYEVADINGKDNDVTLTNNTALTANHFCPEYPPGTGGACKVQGEQTGSLRSLSGRLALIYIGVTYDY